ncbi:MAG: hypothetical protein M3R61_20290, partial [Chloroflexota bacterium]|nr:hypothetical protein [Chloroflexota bacterium]
MLCIGSRLWVIWCSCSHIGWMRECRSAWLPRTAPRATQSLRGHAFEQQQILAGEVVWHLVADREQAEARVAERQWQ